MFDSAYYTKLKKMTSKSWKQLMLSLKANACRSCRSSSHYTFVDPDNGHDTFLNIFLYDFGIELELSTANDII